MNAVSCLSVSELGYKMTDVFYMRLWEETKDLVFQNENFKVPDTKVSAILCLCCDSQNQERYKNWHTDFTGLELNKTSTRTYIRTSIYVQRPIGDLKQYL